jgi:hypothetical protein
MQIVNKGDKEVTFAKVEIEPKSSVTIHDSFITKADLEQEGVKVVNHKLVYVGYKEDEQDNKDNKLLDNGGNDSDLNNDNDTSKELEPEKGSDLEDETIVVEELDYQELKAKVEELGLEVENNKKATLQKALQEFLDNKDKED